MLQAELLLKRLDHRRRKVWVLRHHRFDGVARERPRYQEVDRYGEPCSDRVEPQPASNELHLLLSLSLSASAKRRKTLVPTSGNANRGVLEVQLGTVDTARTCAPRLTVPARGVWCPSVANVHETLNSRDRWTTGPAIGSEPRSARWRSWPACRWRRCLASSTATATYRPRRGAWWSASCAITVTARIAVRADSPRALGADRRHFADDPSCLLLGDRRGLAEAVYEQDMRIVFCPTLHEHDKQVSLLERLTHGTIDCALLSCRRSRAASCCESWSTAFASSSSTRAGDSTARADRRRRSLLGRRTDDAPPDRARAPADRGDNRPTGMDGDRRALARLPGCARRRRRAPEPRLVIESDFESGAGWRTRPTALRVPTVQRRYSPSTTSSRSARCKRLAPSGCDPSRPVDRRFRRHRRGRDRDARLTTVHQPLAEIGRISVSLLTRLLDGQRVEALHVELETKLILRDSTAVVG